MIMDEDFDGLDTFRAIRALMPDQKCILFSGYAETDRVNKALAEGACSFIKKPYTMQLLGRRVREALLEGSIASM
jgi:DNA-binding NtrC family response regulator